MILMAAMADRTPVLRVRLSFNRWSAVGAKGLCAKGPQRQRRRPGQVVVRAARARSAVMAAGERMRGQEPGRPGNPIRAVVVVARTLGKWITAPRGPAVVRVVTLRLSSQALPHLIRILLGLPERLSSREHLDMPAGMVALA